MGTPVRDIPPMLAIEQPVPAFTDPAWLYEVKWDGYRTLAGIGPAGVEMRSRGGSDCTGWYPEVADVLRTLKGEHVLDGEACVLDSHGRSDFEALHARARRRRWVPGGPQVTLMVFDLLVHRGKDVMHLPLVQRKALLQKLLAKVPKTTVLYVGDLPAEKELFADVVLAMQLEGFVAKRRDSVYTPGVRSPAWLKIKRKGAVPAQRFKR